MALLSAFNEPTWNTINNRYQLIGNESRRDIGSEKKTIKGCWASLVESLSAENL